MSAALPQPEFACFCCRVKQSAIRAAIREGCRTAEQVRDRTGAGRKCGGCVDYVGRLIQQYKREEIQLRKQAASGQQGLPF